MATVRYSGNVQTASFATDSNDSTNGAIDSIRATLIDAGWIEGDPIKASTPGPPFHGAPYYNGPTDCPGCNPVSGHVLGLIFPQGLLVDGTEFWFYNGAMGQPDWPGVVNVQIGSSVLGTLGSLAGKITFETNWNATVVPGDGTSANPDRISFEYKYPGTLGNNNNDGRLFGSGTWTGSFQQPFGGGYQLQSQDANNNSAFSIKIQTDASGRLTYTIPELAIAGAADVVPMAGSAHLDFWANPYGFSMHEPNDFGTINSPRNIMFIQPWLPDTAGSPCLLRLAGTSRKSLDTPFSGITSLRALIAGTVYSDPQWAWYAPRASNRGVPLCTTAGKPLFFDSWLALSSSNAIEKRIMGWVYDSVLTTEAVAVDAQAELGGSNWMSWRSTFGGPGDYGTGAPQPATVWLLMPT